MSQTLQEMQTSQGAEFGEVAGARGIVSFGNDPEAIQAARSSVAVVDRSLWGLLQVTGDDRIRYLHNQSTNDFYSLKAGQGCETVFVTSTARTIDLVTAYILEDGVWLFVSPQRRKALLSWLDRYIFGADRVELADITDTYCIFTLLGPKSHAVLEQLAGVNWQTQPPVSHAMLSLAGVEGRVAVGTGLALEGYTLMVPADGAAKVWGEIVAMGTVPLGDRAWEQLRIEQGRPAPDSELTEDYNPLEAGLWHTISFSKGCYIGQETIARLNTYQGVKQQLWGVRLDRKPPIPSLLMVDGDRVGKLTSLTETADGLMALGYIRTKAGGAGLKVQVVAEVGNAPCAEGVLIDLPFVTRVPQ
ncbi:MAG: folate-binding protein [Leptolyngbyaceae cyanobacterium bins.59]|nr:folate-binding protein [Leptolyngbyaceae cyanobacterium bins.59]